VRSLIAIAVAGLLLLAAGCGGGGKKPSSTLVSSTSITKPSSSGGAEPSSGPNEQPPAFASAKNCRDLAGLAARVASTMTATSGNPATALKVEAAELQRLATAAPSDIRGDFQTFASAFSSFLHTLEQAGYKPGSSKAPTAAQIAALSKAARSFDTAKLRHAEQHLSAWAAHNCKGVHVGG
jgi:hypothetical protein